MILFEFIIVVIGVGPELQLLDLHYVLLFLGFVLLLFQLVLIVAVIDGLGDGWHRGGRNQDQIEAHLLRLPQRGGSGHDFGFAVRKNSPYLAHPDGLIYVFSASLLAGRKLSAWSHASCVGIRSSLPLIRSQAKTKVKTTIMALSLSLLNSSKRSWFVCRGGILWPV